MPRHSLPLSRPAVARSQGIKGVDMHVLIAGLYAAILWLALLAYTVIIGLSAFWVLVLGPVVISGLIAALLVLDLVLDPLWPILARRWAWLSSATVRLWRSIPPRRSGA
jgi:hypothetical protein